MAPTHRDGANLRTSLRLWPGVLAAALLLLVRYVLPAVGWVEGSTAIIGGFAGSAGVLAWWLLFSRAPWVDRLGAVGVMAVAVVATSGFVHESVANGMMGNMLVILAVPLLCLALVAAVVVGNRLSTTVRRATVAAAIVLVAGSLLLLRTEGINGSAASDLHWRWTPTPEERLLARAAREPLAFAPRATAVPALDDRLVDAGRADGPATVASAPLPVAVTSVAEAPVTSAAVDRQPAQAALAADVSTTPAWTGFRGPQRDDVIRGVRIATDWAASPPVELWRRPVGPGWSSFAVSGDRVYTQEQRGDEEIVSCYSLRTGDPLWLHRDATRFWESNGGAGPRATPALSRGRVFAFGATGVLNALDARDGSVIWSRNAAADTGQPVPGWGFASSPLIVGDRVLVHAGTLVAYDAATGERRWTGPAHSGGYSSPHRVVLHGVPQILMMSGDGLASVSPEDGTLLWAHAWSGSPIVQPALLADGGVLISTADAMGGSGTRRIAVTHGEHGWTVDERWTSKGLKPYFNDFVVHNGRALGFDGNILASIDLADGARRWKGGRYGNGQLVLLADQDVLLVLSEDGELALVDAVADRFTELARFPALDGKTWNHPVLVGDVLLVRNAEEMAAFRLSLVDR